MILDWIKFSLEILTKLHPETKTLIIILLLGWVLYSKITNETQRQMCEKAEQEILHNKKAE